MTGWRSFRLGPVLAVMLAPGLSGQTPECGCRGYDDPLSAFRAGRIIVRGTVTALGVAPDSIARIHPVNSGRVAHVTVHEWWSPGPAVGTPLTFQDEVAIYTMDHACGYPFTMGEEYLIAVAKLDRRLPWTRQCSGTSPLRGRESALDELGPSLAPGESEPLPPSPPEPRRPILLYVLALLLGLYLVVAGALTRIVRRNAQARRGPR